MSEIDSHCINYPFVKEYDQGFRDLIDYCEDTFTGDHGDFLGEHFIIGGGNPSSRILFIGKEASHSSSDPKQDYNTLAHYRYLINNSLTDSALWVRNRQAEEQCQPKEELKYWYSNRTVWYNYQRLYDIIVYGLEDGINRDHSETMDFETQVFCSELSGIPMKMSDYSKKSKESLQLRKEKFFTHEFFNRFDIVIIFASGNYIKNKSSKPEKREIDRIFGVEYQIGECYSSGTGNSFWVHRERPGFPRRLVIQTRNPSANIDMELIKKIGEYAHNFYLSSPSRDTLMK